MEETAKYKMLKIYISEDDQYKKGKNLYHNLVLKFRELGIAGVTVTRGVEGYGEEKKLKTAKILDLSSSLPIIIDVIDKEKKIQEVIPIVKEMIKAGLVLVVDVDIIKAGSIKC